MKPLFTIFAYDALDRNKLSCKAKGLRLRFAILSLYMYLYLLPRWAIHNGANWQDDGAIKETMGIGKNMNGANLLVFLLEVNGANSVFLSKKGNIVRFFFI